MTSLQRLLAPLSVLVAAAAAAPAAQAAQTVSSVSFAGTTVEIVEPGAASNTVHMTVTAPSADALENAKVFLGGDSLVPDHAVSVDGVRDARYAAAGDDVDGELSTESCLVYNGSSEAAPVTVSGDGTSFSADLPKGEVIAFEETRVAVGVAGSDAACQSQGFQGLALDYTTMPKETIDGFTWDAPAAPVVTATGGRRQVALSFDQAPGTKYDIFRVGEETPFRANVRGDGQAVQVVLDEGDDGQRLDPGTRYEFRVQATRLFNFWTDERDDMFQRSSPLSDVAAATTAAAQSVRFTSVPATGTTDRNARFSWSIDGLDAGEAPVCVLDMSETSGAEVPCTATGAAIDGVTVGAHTLTVFTPDGEGVAGHAWSVAAAAATTAAPTLAAVTPPAPPAPPAPVAADRTDPDGDGIKNTWLVAGKPAAAPASSKAGVRAGKVTLRLGKAPRGAKKLLVFRAEGKGAYKLVKTLAPKAKAFTDSKVKAGRTYSYKTVGTNAKGQQSAASKKTVAKVGKRR